MNLTILQAEVAEWSARNFPGKLPHQPLLGVQEETGELAHAHLKGEQGIRHTPEEIRAMKMDAVADIVIYLADYCEQNQISFGVAVTHTWEAVKRRDWQKNRKDGQCT